MNVLPWLVLHGAAVWQAGLVLSIAAGLALAAWRPRAAARRAARAARARLGWPVSLARAPRDARVTLAGRIEAVDAACRRFEDGSEAAAVSGAGAGARAERLSLRAGDVVVRLDGPIEVLAGSREAWPGRALGRLPAAVRGRVGGEDRVTAGSGAPVFRSLASGDAVRVSGVLDEEASDEAPSYRDAGKRWTLGGGLVAAFEGAAAVSGPAAVVRIVPAVAGGLLFLAVSGLGGEIAMAVAARQLVAYESGPDGGPLGAVAIAAATPFRRADALGGLVRALDARRDPEPGTLAARAALHALRGERAEAAAVWIAQGEPERGARLAEEAGSFALAARGWYAAGDFDKAADAWERASSDTDEDDLRFGLGLHLFARRLDRAAHTARRLAEALRTHPADNDRLQRWYAARAETAACVADALDARRGDAEAWRRLHEPRPGPLTPACAVLRVDLFEGSARIQAIRALPGLAQDVHDVPREWLGLLAAEADAAGTEDVALPFESAAEVLAIPNGGWLARAVPGVERQMAEALARSAPLPMRVTGSRMLMKDGRRSGCVPMWGPRQTPARVRASAAVFAFLTGDRPGAEALARGAGEGPGALAAEVAAVTALPGDPRSAAEMVARAPGEFLHGLLDFVVDRDAGAIQRALEARPPPDEDEKRAWSLAAAGDGVALARWLRRPISQPGTFLRLGAPLLRGGRGEVAGWVRWGYRPTAAFRPTEEAVHLASLAAAAEALDPGEGAASLRERAARFRQAILRRETAVPLAVLERL